MLRGSWLRTNFFSSWPSGVATLASLLATVLVLRAVVRWSIVDAAFGTTPESCRAASGACWSIIGDLWQLFLVGIYPQSERWRVIAAALVLAAGTLGTAACFTRAWAWALACWIAGLLAGLLLLRGGRLFGLPPVETQNWGGLMLTVVLAAVGQSLALPLGILLALARRARAAPVLRLLAVVYIETVRSLPFVMILLMAALVLPLFMPRDWPLDRLAAAQSGIVLFAAAMIAEVVRGGLQGVPEAQEQAALALGLSWAQATRLVVLPQALRLVQPALIGTVIAFVKGSTLVVAIGLYDLLGAAVLASANQRWVGITIEPLLFVAAIFWTICFALSRLSARLARTH
jgi:general L-amino acid transport system permease protein